MYVCGKSGCGTGGERRAVRDALAGAAEVVEVGCQSVCDGPVAGTVVAGRLEWFRRVATRKRRNALVALAGGIDRPGKPLAKRRVAKRSGKLSGKVRG